MQDHLVVNALVAAMLNIRLNLINSLSSVWFCVQELISSREENEVESLLTSWRHYRRWLML